MFTSDSKGNATAYPLSWPTNWPRTPRARIGWSSFMQHSAVECSKKLLDEVRLMGGRNIIISTNVRLRLDGLPYSNQKQPDDCGAAVYFNWRDKPIVFACDRWRTVEENLWAIAKHIEALRGQERWGVGDLEQAFAGYVALPAPASAQWWTVLGVNQNATVEEIRSAYREKVKHVHPDVGGNHDQFVEVQQAYEQALRERGQ